MTNAANVSGPDKAYYSAALEKSKVVSTQRAKLNHVVCYNAAGFDVYLLIFDKAAVPADSSAAQFAPLKIPNGSTANYDFPNGHPMGVGITVAASSTDNQINLIVPAAGLGVWFTVSYMEKGS